jgi:tetratricopeptide (TPR) repeat protein
MSFCPGEATLRSLGTDGLDDGSFAAIEEHVEGCPECQAVLERLAHRRRHPTVALAGTERWPLIPGFEIQSRLGRGAMGVVYLASETGLDRLVALKILPGALGPDASTSPRRRWLREARAVSSVRHPNIVPLYNYGEADEWFFLVLEYVPGGTLRKRLAEPLPPRVAAGLMETIARAVGYIHGRGLFHLDLKPSNILLDGAEDGPWDLATPRISDFGLAISNDDAGHSETSLAGIRGTPSYMAPEQAAASRAGVGASADIHALGAILYELLTGRPPFQGTSTLETLDQVRSQNPVPPRRLNPKIPRDLETIALKCLEKNPSRRYASAEVLAGDLRRWLDGKPISARPVSPIEHAGRWCFRRPAVAMLMAALLMTLSVGFVAIGLLWRHAEAARAHADQQRIHAERERHLAEEERLHAEADYKLARAALADVFELGRRGLGTKDLTREHLIVSLQGARSRLLDLARTRPNDPEIWKLVASVDLVLGRDLDVRGKLFEVRPLLVEAVFYLERILHKDPHDPFAQQHRRESLVRLANVIKRQGNTEESVRHWERAIALVGDMLAIWSNDELETLAGTLPYFASLVERRGDDQYARTILEATLRSLSNLPSNSLAARVRVYSRKIYAELFLLEGPSRAEFERLNAEDWAERTAGYLFSTLGPSDIDPIEGAESGYWLTRSLCVMAASERHNGKVEEARRIADRMHALAQLLVARYPDLPAAHLAMQNAFEQRAKNAWQAKDRVAIERNWRLALSETRQAGLLDPQDAETRLHVTVLQQRLNDLVAPPK